MRVAMDQIAPEHRAVDEALEAWGEWGRNRRTGHCGSFEHAYRSPWWQWRYPEARIQRRSGLPLEIERVMVEVPAFHREALVLHYQRKKTPAVICKQLALRYEFFPKLMYDARAMVKNLLKRRGIVLQSSEIGPDDGCGLAGPAVLAVATA